MLPQDFQTAYTRLLLDTLRHPDTRESRRLDTLARCRRWLDPCVQRALARRIENDCRRSPYAARWMRLAQLMRAGGDHRRDGAPDRDDLDVLGLSAKERNES